jgi:hypothetical protein
MLSERIKNISTPQARFDAFKETNHGKNAVDCFDQVECAFHDGFERGAKWAQKLALERTPEPTAHIAALEKLEAENARLRAPVSDEEWASWTINLIPEPKSLYRCEIDALLAARAAELAKEELNGQS